MPNNSAIGIFDSGVGGLSVFRQLKKAMPMEHFIYLADQKNFPYGQKSRKELQKISLENCQFLLKQKAKLIIIACNSASCYSLKFLRTSIKIPIVGVVPAIKPAAILTKNSRIAILSTPATSKSSYLKNLISSFAKNTKVLNISAKGLEKAIENQDSKTIEILLKKYYQKIQEFKADVLVLGCTHFPLILAKLKKEMPNLLVLDSSKAIAKRVNSILKTTDNLAREAKSDAFYTTANTNDFSKIASTLLKYKVKAKSAKIS